MVKKKSVKKPISRSGKKQKAAKAVRSSKATHSRSSIPKTSRMIHIPDPDHLVDMKKHTVKTTSPDVHVIGPEPKTAHQLFQEKDGRKEMLYDYDTVLVNEKKGTTGWFRKYSPVLITLGIGLLTYFYLIFYMFYPAAIMNGKFVQFALIIIFLFLAAGILLFLGLRSELLFVRVLSFIFVFVIFTFLLLFILVTYSLKPVV
jgi:hypothetical protein